VIADVVFDLPGERSFSYLVPPGLTLRPGQRVAAPLRGRPRVGVVVEVRESQAAGLASIARVVDPVPLVPASSLALARWAAAESLSSWGSTLLALLPPPPGASGAEPMALPAEPRASAKPTAELWVGAGREARLVDELGAARGSALVIAPDRETAARWAARLDGARLDGDAPAAERRAVWLAAARGRTRTVVGTRSALLAPVPPPATLAVVDEADAAHKPPGHPRLHSREIMVERAWIEGGRLLLLAAAPAAETWWRARAEGWTLRDHTLGPWPEVVTADTRGILRNHPLTLPLTRAIEETTRGGRRVALLVGRRPAGLGCAECGALLRCPDCGLPLGHQRARAMLSCALCGRLEPLPDRCPGCRGHRFASLGWDADRVEASVRRRFPRLSVSRTDVRAQVVIGTSRVIRAAGPGELGAVGVVALDALLGAPDFRAGERAFGLLWTAAEAVRPGGRLVVQTRHPEHEAVRAVTRRQRAAFYGPELAFREELGYPPFRRLCRITARGGAGGGAARALVQECARALEGIADLKVYPPAATGLAGARVRLLVKGPATLPRLIRELLADVLAKRRRADRVVEVEMDPVS